MAASRATRLRRRPANPLVRTMLLGAFGVALLSMLLGYLVGGAQTPSPRAFSDEQTHWIEGYREGVLYSTADKAAGDPLLRCAAKYYLRDPAAFTGCQQALQRPRSGYALPPAPR